MSVGDDRNVNGRGQFLFAFFILGYQTINVVGTIGIIGIDVDHCERGGPRSMGQCSQMLGQPRQIAIRRGRVTVSFGTVSTRVGAAATNAKQKEDNEFEDGRKMKFLYCPEMFYVYSWSSACQRRWCQRRGYQKERPRQPSRLKEILRVQVVNVQELHGIVVQLLERPNCTVIDGPIPQMHAGNPCHVFDALAIWNPPRPFPQVHPPRVDEFFVLCRVLG